jgi:hydrogenase-1 operon protein HyaF
MVQNFHLPPTGFGPGSQADPNEGPELEYMPLPSGMRTYSPHLPEIDEIEDDVSEALSLLAEMADAADRVAKGGPSETFDLADLSGPDRALLAETLGDGEVSMKLRGVPALAVQESVFAGVWQIKGANVDVVEIASVPDAARSRAFDPVARALGKDAPRPPQVVNAPALLAELTDKSAAYAPGVEAHVVNLTLLPHTEADLDWLAATLGTGSVDVLSRGYGNCRVTATATPHVWHVQFFNSMDTRILDTYEVGPMPEVALAATEDLADSAERLREVLEAIR